MVSFRKILFPVDYSERCRGAASYVEVFAGRFDAEIVLLHVVQPYGVYDYPGYDYDDAALENYLDEELRLFKVKRISLTGDPAARILEVARSEEVDLIMLPTHGYGRFRRFLLGSVTAKVLHDAECPVWTGVHMENAPTIENVQFRSLLCAIDLEDKSINTLRWAAALADEYGAELTIVHAVPGVTTRPGKYFDSELQVMLLKMARDDIERFQEIAGTRAKVCLHGGDVAEVVREAAVRHGSDMVIIGRTAPGVLGRLRTHSYSIIRESPCPVLSV